MKIIIASYLAFYNSQNISLSMCCRLPCQIARYLFKCSTLLDNLDHLQVIILSVKSTLCVYTHADLKLYDKIATVTLRLKATVTTQLL